MQLSHDAINLEQASLADYPLITRMWPFYVYELGRYCGFNPHWQCPIDLSFVADDLSPYFMDSSRRAFLLKVNDALAGFVLLNKVGSFSGTEWNMAEFFIINYYQKKGIGQTIAAKIFNKFPGAWDVSVIPENTRALLFWKKVILNFTHNHYVEQQIAVNYDQNQPMRTIFRFDVKHAARS